MAAPQFDRDLRSANKEWRRTKDANVKWSHGARYLHGVRRDSYGEPLSSVPACQLAKERPSKRPSEISHTSFKSTQNLTKLRPNTNYDAVPSSRRRAKLHAKVEIHDADTTITTVPYSPLCSPALTRSATLGSADPFVYSFDRTDSPGRPLTLEVFVKTTGRETEKLVEREYEVLDGNGEAVRGRRARAVLRRTGASKERGGDNLGAEGGGGEEDEGFELV